MMVDTVGGSDLHDISESAKITGISIPVLVTPRAWALAVEADTTGEREQQERAYFLASALRLRIESIWKEQEAKAPKEDAELPERFCFDHRGHTLAVIVGVTSDRAGLRLLVGYPGDDK